MASFNTEQQKAISAGADKNILISAGAGSGKTKTLTERVFSLIDQGKVKPSELLVRTFTNNAAHERKERIVARFEKAEKSEKDPVKKKRYKKLSDERLSSHVQTFDSFSQYLAVSYASELGISPNITIADETVRETRKQVLLDELLKETYLDKDKSKALFELVHSLTMQNDNVLRKIILDIDDKRSSITEEEKNKFFYDYENTYLSDEVLSRFKQDYISNTKEKIKHGLVYSYLLSNFYSSCNDKEKDVPVRLANSRLNNDVLYRLRYNELPFLSETEQKRYRAYLDLLQKEGDSFILSLANFVQDNKELFAITRREKKLFGGPNKGEGFFYRKERIHGQKAIIFPITGNPQELISRAKERKEPILFLLSLVKELEKRVEDFKKVSNSFTFADVDKRALSLLTDNKYKDIADEIRERFTYIRVDEYQDTNDAQELFLAALRKPHKGGKQAHIFCVGDAKQSIYGFRNSKVELFRNRQKDYIKNPEHGEVITRNRNYRSQPLLLHQINEIFKKYRTLDHGGIDYQSIDEQLNYDEAVDLYKDKKRQNHQFGISRIISVREDYDGAKKSIDKVRWEIEAIADDISKKRKDGFEIFDRDIGGLRPVRYSDFGILCRVKTNFSLYQEIFQQRGIPLNSSQENSLSEVEPVIVIESLVGLRSYMRGKNPTCQVKHLFASLARSYIRNYPDDKLYTILSYGKTKQVPQGTLDLVKQDPLWEKRKEFIDENRDNSFTQIYTNRISSFHLIDNLYQLGNIYVSISKLESMRSMVKNQEDSGEGREDFLALRQNRNKYKVEFTDKSSIRNADAVNLRTIHGSKGLERNVLYRPVLQNKISKGNPRDEPDYDFSLKYGILLPNYFLDPIYDKKGELISFQDEEYYPFNYKLFQLEDHDKEEKDEHVRLFYVAVTRAENNLIFVGDGMKSSDKKQEDALYRLQRLKNHKERNPLLLQDSLKKEDLEKAKNALDELRFPLEGKRKDKESTLLYQEISAYILDYYQKNYQSTRDEIRGDLGSLYRKKFTDSNPSLDDICRLFSYHFWKKDFNSFDKRNEYIDSFATESLEEDDEDNDETEKEPFGISDRKNRTEEERKDYRSEFFSALKDGKPEKLNEKSYTSKSDTASHINIDFLLSFAYYFTSSNPDGGVKYAIRTSYYMDDYRVPYTIFTKKNLSKQNGKKDYQEFLFEVPTKENGLLNDSEIQFQEVKKIRASKKIISDDTQASSMNYGTYLHTLRQCLNLRNPDFTLIPGSQERERLKKVFDTPIRKKAKESTSYRQEFHYNIDDDERSQGSLDLFFVKDKEYYIVDYKTKNIEDDAYPKQLHVYQHVIERLYPASKNHIHLYLLSILDADEKEIPAENDSSL